MAKKKEILSVVKKPVDYVIIPVKDLKIGTLYKTYQKDIVKIEKIDEERQSVVMYNATAQCRQWVDFRHVLITNKIY